MPTNDPEGDVPALELLFGNRPWTLASESGTRASCGICGTSVAERGRAVCAGCMVVGGPFDGRLRDSRRSTEAKERQARKAAAKFAPKAPVASQDAFSRLSPKERRGIVRDHRRTAEGRAWLVAQGLL